MSTMSNAPLLPELCTLCGKPFHGSMDGHGLGECVDICTRCGGAGAVLGDGEEEQCPRCKGTGAEP